MPSSRNGRQPSTGSRHMRGRPTLWLMIAVPVCGGIAALFAATASAAVFAASASVTGPPQYLGDSTGTVRTFTVKNTGTTNRIGAVEIQRPSADWGVSACPSGPAGWTRAVTATGCRYTSAATSADDITIGASRTFQLTSKTTHGRNNRVGTWRVIVSKANNYVAGNLATAAPTAPGALGETTYTWQVLSAPVTGSAAYGACPAVTKTAHAGATKAVVVCAKNHSYGRLQPIAGASSLGGTFVATPGTFGSVSVPARSATYAVAAWDGTVVTSAVGGGKTVITKIGSAWNQTSPVTTLTGYMTTNAVPTAGADAFSGTEDGTISDNVLGNDADADGDTITATQATAPAHGTLSLAPSGAFTYTPAPDYNGGDSFSYRVSDGFSQSGIATVTLTVGAVNDGPANTVPAAQSIGEGDSLTFGASNGLSISDVDAGASDVTTTLTVANGTLTSPSLAGLTSSSGNGTATLVLTGPVAAVNGALDDLTYQPAANAVGSDTLTMVTSDNGATGAGGVLSDTDTVGITINAVNDAPSFTKGADQTLLEDAGAQSVSGWATAISPGPADESGQAVDFVVTNDNTSLFTSQPAIAPDGTLTYTSAPDAFGTATVTVAAHDDGGGSDTSAPQTFTIAVTPVNDAPSFTAGAASTVAEDAGAQSVTGWATGMSAGPANEAAQALNFTVTTDNDALFSALPTVSPAGTLTYTAAPNANGVATLTVTLLDDGGTANGGDDSSAGAPVTVTVTAVNDAPSFTKGANETLLEDAGAQSVSGWATAISAGPADESGQAVDFVVTNDNGSLFAMEPAIAPNGTLTFTPAADAFGTATVTVAAHDDGGGSDTSAPQTFTITVNPVNDAPTFSAGANQASNEDAGAQSVPAWATGISTGPANESAQLVTFTVTNTANALFAAQPAISADGTLTYTAAPNANGPATISVTMSDDGGTATGGDDTSDTKNFTITVNAVNDAPSFTKGADQTLLEDAGAQSVSNWATAISKGPADESAQTLSFTTSNDNNALFSLQPGVTPDGTLTYTTAPNAVGSATVTISLSDTGGTANGGDDTSDAQTFTVTATPVNDAPSFTKGANVSVLQDSAAQSVTGWATAISAGPADEAGQAVDFVVTNDNASLFSAAPAVAPNGTLTYTPASGATGSSTVTVSLHDDGGTAGGGADTSAPQTFTISVVPPNETPIAAATSASGDEDGGPITVTLTGDDADGDALTFTAGTASNGLVTVPTGTVCASGHCTATVTYSPGPNFNGTDTFTYTVNDGTIDSAAATATVTVDPVNDAPTFTPGADPAVNEDSGAYAASFASDVSAGPANESAQAVTFEVTNNTNPGLFSAVPAISGTGELTFTPAANANGSAVVTYRAKDDGGTANGGADAGTPLNLTITVNPVNDVPSFTKGADQTLLEDAGAQSVSNWATAISKGPADESAQTLSFTTSNDNNALFSVQPGVSPTGTLVYTTAPNAVGSATVTISLSDTGGTANNGDDTSDAQTFTVTATPVNDEPSFTHAGNQTALEDAGARTVNGFVTGTSAGPADESAQTVTVAVTGTSNDALFQALPAIDSAGVLTYTPAANANGVATVTVRATDDGGTANSGDDTSGNQTFTITVTPVNDAPSFTKGADQTLLEDAGAQSVSNWATAISKGPANESAQALGFTVTNSNNALFLTQPTVSSTGTLTYTSAANKYGTATVSVTLIDDGGTDDGGDDTSDVQTFTITVNPVNDAPTAIVQNFQVQTNMKISLGGLLTGAADANDTSQEPAATYTPVFTVGSITPGASCVGCTISNVNNSNGSFDFEPPAGQTGSFSVTYTVVDSGYPGPGVASAAQTINFTVSGDVVWFVDGTNGADGANRGTLTSPFKTLAAASGVDLANHKIFVHSGTYSEPLTLLSGELLAGSGAKAASFDALFGVAPPAGTVARPSINGTNPTIGGSLTLGSGNTVRGLTLTGSPALTGSSFGTLALGNNGTGTADVVLNSSGQALSLTVGTVNGDFVSTTSTGGSDNVHLSGVQTTTSTSLGSGALSGATDDALEITGQNGTFSYSGTVGNANAGDALAVLNKTGGTVTLSGAINDTSGTGVTLTNNGGSVVNLTGGVTLNTGAGNAFAATGGGTVSVTGAANTITTTGGTALNIANTTIGASDVTFRSINVNTAGAAAPANGIVLNNTGTSGNLVVTGTGTAASGGTIRGTTGQAVSLTTTRDVSLTHVRIQDAANDGIHGNGITNLTLTGVQILGPGDGDEERAIDLTNAAGTVTISGGTYDDSADDLVKVNNTSVNVTVNVSNGATFSNQTQVNAGNAFDFVPNGTSAITASITGSTFSNLRNTSVNFGAGAAGSNGTSSLAFNTNTVTGGAGGAAGVTISGQEGTTTNVTVNGNNFSGAGGNGVVNHDVNDNSNVRSTVAGNTFTSPKGHAIVGAVDEDADARIHVTNNTISNAGGDGIQLTNFGDDSAAAMTSTAHFIVTNNQINGHSLNPATTFVGGVAVFHFENDADTTCAKISNNSVTGTNAAAGQFDIFLQDNGVSKLMFEESPNTAATGTVSPAYIQSINPGTSVSNIDNVGAYHSNGATCVLP